MPTLAEEVRRLRLEAKLSQEKLAELAGVTQGFITHLETGKREGLGADVLYRLCDALGVKCDHFREMILPEAPKPEEKPKKKGRGK